MNNKGGIFLDCVVGVVILSFVLIILSNYTGNVINTEKNINANLQMQLDVNNLIEYIYSNENWENLNRKNWDEDIFASFKNLKIEHNYDTELTKYDTEKLYIYIKGPIKSDEYILERSAKS